MSTSLECILSSIIITVTHTFNLLSPVCVALIYMCLRQTAQDWKTMRSLVSRENDSPSLSSPWLPMALYLEVGPCEMCSHVCWHSSQLRSLQGFCRQPQCGEFMGAAFLATSKRHYLIAVVFHPLALTAFAVPLPQRLLSLRCKDCIEDEPIGDRHPVVVSSLCLSRL